MLQIAASAGGRIEPLPGQVVHEKLLQMIFLLHISDDGCEY
jgi:hypothetical protein